MQQESNGLAQVGGLDHLLSWNLALRELRHRGIDKARRKCRTLDSGAACLAMRGLGEVDYRGLGCCIDREPSLPAFARNRGGVEDQGLTVLFARLTQHRQALASTKDQRPEVDGELHIEVLSLDLFHRCTNSDSSIVDQNIESPIGLAMFGEGRNHVLLLGHVGDHALHLKAVGEQLLGGGRQLLCSAGGDGERKAFFPQGSSDRQADSARGSCDQRRPLCHSSSDCFPGSLAPYMAYGRGARRHPYYSSSLNNMASMSLGRSVVASVCLFAAATLSAGCGGSSASSAPTYPAPTATKSRPAAPLSEFPAANGKTMAQVLRLSGGPSDLVVSPTAQVFYKGQNRFPFEVFERDRTQVSSANIAIYIAKAPPKEIPHNGLGSSIQKRGKATKKVNPLHGKALGPFPASVESLATKPAFRSLTTARDPAAATSVYASNIDFPSNGEWRILALLKQGKKTTATLLPSAMVGEFHKIPRVGQKAPVIQTPTAASVDGDLSKITTRVPPDTQNVVNYAKVLGKEPIILLFATPKFCQSRACSPVVDVAQQVKQRYGGSAAFIHMEIYNENNPSKGVRPQVRAFNLPSVPWLFVIDRRGVIRSTIEGAFGVEKLTQEVRGVTGE